VNPVPTGTIIYIDADGNSSVAAEGICPDSEGGIWIAGAGRRALLVKEGGIIERQVTTDRPVFATAVGGPNHEYLFLCTSDSNDPVMTRQVAGATIDFAVLGAL